jgi:regulatory protein
MARRTPEPLDRSGLMNYALRILSTRGLSTSEIRAKLQRRAAEASDVDDVIAKLQEGGLLNDVRFAESYAAARLENQGFGKVRVLRDLRQRRVAGSVAATAVEQTFEGTDEEALVEQFLARKFRGKVLAEFLAVDKNLVSAFRRLRVAGFGAGVSIRVLKRFAAQAESLEGVEEGEPEGSE